jgi:hypothetical protein
MRANGEQYGTIIHAVAVADKSRETSSTRARVFPECRMLSASGRQANDRSSNIQRTLRLCPERGEEQTRQPVHLVMHRSILFLCTSLLAAWVMAQPAPSIAWQRTLGGWNMEGARSLLLTADGGYLLGGHTDSYQGDVSGTHGAVDVWLVKLDSSAELQWQMTLGGSGNEEAYDVRATADGGYIVAGFTSSVNDDVSGAHGGVDAWVVKVDSVGELEWQRCLGGMMGDGFNAVRVLDDGGFFLVGSTNSNDGDVADENGGVDIWMARLSAAGDLLWQDCIGGTGFDDMYAMEPCPDGGYVLAGRTTSSDGDVTGGQWDGDGWLVKLDETFAIEWQRTVGGTHYDVFQGVTPTQDGGYLAVGRTDSNDGDVSGNHGGHDAWMVKVDGSGAFQWQRTFGGSADEEAVNVLRLDDGGYLMSSITYSADGDVTDAHGALDAWLVRTDGEGNLLWQRSTGGSDADALYAMCALPEGGTLLAGTTLSNDGDVTGNHGSWDLWVLRLEAEGISLGSLPHAGTSCVVRYDADAGLIRFAGACTEEGGYVELADARGQVACRSKLRKGAREWSVPSLVDGLYVCTFVGSSSIRAGSFVVVR